MLLVRPHFLEAEQLGRAPMELREACDVGDVRLDGARRAVPDPQIVDHPLAQRRRHGGPPLLGGPASPIVERRRPPAEATIKMADSLPPPPRGFGQPPFAPPNPRR